MEYLPDISVSVLFLEAYIDCNGPIDELGRRTERERERCAKDSFKQNTR